MWCNCYNNQINPHFKHHTRKSVLIYERGGVKSYLYILYSVSFIKVEGQMRLVFNPRKLRLLISLIFASNFKKDKSISEITIWWMVGFFLIIVYLLENIFFIISYRIFENCEFTRLSRQDLQFYLQNDNAFVASSIKYMKYEYIMNVKIYNKKFS